jgi:hypothetical protein
LLATNRWKYTANVLIVWGCAGVSATYSGRVEPDAREAVVPRVFEADLRQIRVPAIWEAGSAVREPADLKRPDAPNVTVALGGHAIRVRGRHLTVYSTDGARVAGPFPFASLWPRSSAPCGTEGEQTVAVQPDRYASRWVIARQVALPDGRLAYCLAVSRTPDPVTGGWWGYAFALPIERGATPLVLSDEAYRLSGVSAGRTVQIIFDRAAMLAGQPSTYKLSTTTNR